MRTLIDKYTEDNYNEWNADIDDSVNVVEPTAEWTSWRLHKAQQMWNEYTTRQNWLIFLLFDKLCIVWYVELNNLFYVHCANVQCFVMNYRIEFLL